MSELTFCLTQTPVLEYILFHKSHADILSRNFLLRFQIHRT